VELAKTSKPNSGEWLKCDACKKTLARIAAKGLYEVKMAKGKTNRVFCTIYAGSICCPKCKRVQPIPPSAKSAVVKKESINGPGK
jgi:hypothetical protein